MPGPEGLSPQPNPEQPAKPHRSWLDRLRDRAQGSGVVGLDEGAQAQLEAARQAQAAPPEASPATPTTEAPPTREEELLASTDGRGWAGHKEKKYGNMPATLQAPEAAPTTAENSDELREAA
jgi:hypothetical protein